MKNIRLYIISGSLMLALWMTISFTAQAEHPAPATSSPIPQPVATVKQIEDDHEGNKLSEPIARVK